MEDAARRLEEAEALSAIFGDDFFELSPDEWVLRCAGVRAELTIRLPKDYPSCSPPELVLDAPVHDELQQACQLFLHNFTPGEEFGVCLAQCFYNFCSSLGSAGDEETAIEAIDVLPSSRQGEAPIEATCAVEAVIKLKTEIAGELTHSLVDAGFEEHGAGVFINGELGVAVEIAEEIHVSVDGIDAIQDLENWVKLQLDAEECSVFGRRLLAWVNTQRAAGDAEDGLGDGVAEQDVAPEKQAAGTPLTGNAAWKARLQAGETVEFRGKGNSLHPRIKSGECCRYAPVFTHDDIKERDVVFCQIKGRYWGHLVKKKTFIGGRDTYEYTISNIHGWENGTCALSHIYGKVIDHWK